MNRSTSASTTGDRNPRRDLVSRPVEALGRAVRRAPRLVVAAVTAITLLMVALAGRAEEAGQGEGMMPDVPEVAAVDVITERFGALDETVVQIVVRSQDASLIGADGYAAATAIEEGIRASDAEDRLADGQERPGVVTWTFPAQQVLDDAPGGDLDDVTVRDAYAAGIHAMPAPDAAMATSLIADDTDATSADRALVLAFIDTEGLAEDADVHAEQLLEIETAIVDAATGADLPAGISVEVFSEGLLWADSDAAFEAEMGQLFGSAFAVIVLILGFVYWVRPGQAMTRHRSVRRSSADVLSSMAAIVAAIVWMTGAAVLLGPGHLGVIGRMNEFSQIIPILLVGLGVDYAIHLTSRYREELGAGAPVDEATVRAITTVGGALALATATTAIGFLTNVFNPIPALRDFGILSAVGITAAFVLMLTFVPAVRVLLDRRAERAGRLPTAAIGRGGERVLPRIMGRTAVLADKAPVATLAVTLILAGAGLYGMSQLDTRFSTTDFVPDDSSFRATVETLTDDFGGGFGDSTEVLVAGDVADAAVHNALVEVHTGLEGVDGVIVSGDRVEALSPVALLAKVIANADTVPAELTEAAADVGLSADLTVRHDADLTELYQELSQVAPEEAGTVLAEDGTGSFDAARIQIPTVATEEATPALMDDLADVLGPVEAAGATAVATSPAIQTEVVVTALQDSQASSLATTLIVAMVLLVLVFSYEQRRPALGVLTTVPVVLVVLWTFGMMAATGIPFGPITATIAALAIGIGLPYAIHVTHRFTEDRARHDDVGDAIRATVSAAGGSMAGSALTTIAGFGVLVTSSLVPFRQLGAVTAYAVGFSLAASTLVLPSLLVLWDRWHHRAATAPVAVPARERTLEPAPA